MKTILIGDCHIGEKCTIPEFVEYQVGEIEKAFDYGRKNDIKDVIFLGDILDNRKSIYIKSLQLIKNKFDSWVEEGFRIRIIVGNHDVFYKNTNSLNGPSELFGHIIDKIKIISDTPVTEMIGNKSFLFVPWITKDNVDKCLDTISDGLSDYCLGHFEINSFVMNNSRKCRSDIQPNMFKEFKYTFSGHFHTRSSGYNILFPGSICQLDWNDFGLKKGFAVLDTETDNVELIDSNDYIFYKVIINDKFDFNSVKDLKDCYIKVYINRKLNKKEEVNVSNLLSRNISYEIIDNTILHDIVNLDDVPDDDLDDIIEAGVEAQENLDDKDKKAVIQLINHYREEMKERLNQ